MSATTDWYLVNVVSEYGGVWLFKAAGSVAPPPPGCRRAAGGKEVMCYEDHGEHPRGSHLYRKTQAESR